MRALLWWTQLPALWWSLNWGRWSSTTLTRRMPQWNVRRQGHWGSRGEPFQPHLNTLRPRQNGRHFADIFRIIFLNENISIPIKISLKFVPKGPFNNIPALVQIMAWRRPGDKPLSEPMMVRLSTHICVTRPQWVKHKCSIIPFFHNICFRCPVVLKNCTVILPCSVQKFKTIGRIESWAKGIFVLSILFQLVKLREYQTWNYSQVLL